MDGAVSYTHLDVYKRQQPRYTDHSEMLPGLYRQIQERLEALPGVRSAAVEMCGGIHCGWITALYVHGRNNLADAQVHGQEDHVGLGFFSTLGIPILRGRDFSSVSYTHLSELKSEEKLRTTLSRSAAPNEYAILSRAVETPRE